MKKKRPSVNGTDPIRIAKYKKARLSGKNKRDSAIAAGISAASASPQASRLERLPEVQNAFKAALLKKNINEDRLAEVLDKGLKLKPGVGQLGYFREAASHLGYGRGAQESEGQQQTILNVIIAINEARSEGLLPPGPIIPTEATPDDAA